jgi:hypothetical protein
MTQQFGVLGFPGLTVEPLERTPLITNLYFIPLSKRLVGVPGLLLDQVEFGAFKVRWNVRTTGLVARYRHPSDTALVVRLYSLHYYGMPKAHISVPIPISYGHALSSPPVLGRLTSISSFMKVSYRLLAGMRSVLNSEPPLGPEEPSRLLLLSVGTYLTETHDEIWVFNQGFWDKDANLYREVQKANWDDVILKEEFKGALQKDVYGFFSSEKVYKDLGIAWKVGPHLLFVQYAVRIISSAG